MRFGRDQHNTRSNESPVEPVTLESLQRIMRAFDDRRAAVPKSVSVNPRSMDAFIARLEREGFIRTGDDGSYRIFGLPIFCDADVTLGCYRLVYERAPGVTGLTPEKDIRF